MDSETFADFLKYSYLLAGQGVKEMAEGNIAPSPAEDACKYCRMGGSCDFSCGADGEERKGAFGEVCRYCEDRARRR